MAIRDSIKLRPSGIVLMRRVLVHEITTNCSNVVPVWILQFQPGGKLSLPGGKWATHVTGARIVVHLIEKGIRGTGSRGGVLNRSWWEGRSR